MAACHFNDMQKKMNAGTKKAQLLRKNFSGQPGKDVSNRLSSGTSQCLPLQPVVCRHLSGRFLLSLGVIILLGSICGRVFALILLLSGSGLSR